MHHDDRNVGGWRLIATIEVADHAQSLENFIGADRRLFVMTDAASSPPGYRWIDISVDARLSVQRTAALATGLLGAIVQHALHDQLDGFRIIAGQHWLEVQVPSVEDYGPATLDRLRFDGASP